MKDILKLLLIVLPVFALAVFGYFNSPMHSQTMENKRQEAHGMLMWDNWYNLPEFDREKWMKQYGFTEDDIDPEVILSSMVSNQ